MDPREKDALLAGAAELGVSLRATAADSLLDYLDRVYRWNSSAKLTTIARLDAVRLHLLDSLALLPMLGHVSTVVDLGSGAGLPGIPLAICHGELWVSLVESRRRKASFLAETVRDLRLDRCTVIERDAATLADEDPRFDAVVSRAFLAPEPLVELASRLIKADGTVFVMTGGAAESLVGAGTAGLVLAAERRFRLPGGGEERRIVALKR